MNMEVRQSRHGVSLIEVLVVTAITSVLVGLILPAIQSIRQAAMQGQDRNQLRQIGLGFQQYAALQEGALPGYGRPSIVSPLVSYSNAPLFEILPFIEPGCPPPYFTLEIPGLGLRFPFVRTFMSPSDPTFNIELTRGSSGASSFVVNGQVFQQAPQIENSIPDGTSQTIAITQRYLVCGSRANFTSYGGANPSPANDPGQCNYTGMRDALFADLIWDDLVPITDWSSNETVSSIPGKTFQSQPTPAVADGRMVQSTYSNGLLACMFDGHVRIFPPSTSGSIFWAAVTPAAGDYTDD